MSILIDQVDKSNGRYVNDSAKVRTANTTKGPLDKRDKPSAYVPSLADRAILTSILKDFRNGWQTMHAPRPEFNDLSLYQRHVVDMLAFNTYQENDGNPMLEDRLGGWKSQAMRPVVRNKAISMSAHRTARQLVPKVFAWNEQNNEQEDDAKVMAYLVDWAREQANYPYMALHRDIAAIYSPISWGYSEYAEVYRSVRDSSSSTGFKQVLDDDESGFKHLPMSTDQVYFSNFYERDVQKQDFIILRRILSLDKAREKYPTASYPNIDYVHGGIVVVMDDANNGFYQVYDPHMRDQDVEEVIRWRKNSANQMEVDSKSVMINGVLIDHGGNPRNDHQYPWDAFYYLPINERCIAGKSLVFAMQSDANIVNEFYQMIIDGGKLNLYPPIVTTGSDKVGIDVMVPGLSLAFADKDVKVNPLRTVSDQSMATAMNTLAKIEASVSETSQDPIQQGQMPAGTPSTAYQISRIEQNAATVLGLSLKFMLNSHVIPYGKLLVSDILQYMTVADTAKVTKDSGLVYKTFFAKEPGATGKMNKISFDGKMPDTMTEDEKMAMSFDLLQAQGGINADMTLWKVNPGYFRTYKYTFTVDGDVLNPRSADLMRAMDLETYDRAIANPVADQEKVFTDLLMATNPKTSRDPSAYVSKQSPAAPPGTPTDPNAPPAPPGAPNQTSAPVRGRGAPPQTAGTAKTPPPIYSAPPHPVGR